MKFTNLLALSLRDTRRHRFRLFVFSAAISIGIGTVVAVGSLRLDLLSQISSESREILGGDLVIRSFFEVSDSLLLPITAASEHFAAEQNLATMVRATGKTQSRLSNVRAVSGNFPLYGAPLTGGDALDKGGALVSANLAHQLEISPGDSVRLGNIAVPVIAVYNKDPGQSGIAASVAPGMFVSAQTLQSSGLVTYGSRIQYSYYYQITDLQKTRLLKNDLEKALTAAGARMETSAEGIQRLGRAYDNLIKFLNIIGFISLVLGALAIYSSVSLYLGEKVRTAAVLKCLGLKGTYIFRLYLLQVLYISLQGSILGSALGWILQVVIGNFSQQFLPVSLTAEPRIEMILLGVLLGVILTLCLALFSLSVLAKTGAMQLLRQGQSRTFGAMEWRGLLIGLLILWMASAYMLNDPLNAFYYLFGLILALGILISLTLILMQALRKLPESRRSFSFRFGMSAIRRPGNQSMLLVGALGIGLFVVFLQSFMQHSVLSYLKISDEAGKANLILFDVSNHQRDSIKNVLDAHGAFVSEEISMVPMRLTALKGKSVYEWKKDTASGIPDHIFFREYRVTARDEVAENEQITAGDWPPKGKIDEVIPISLEYFTAGQMNAALGDRLSFSIYGVPYETRVAAIRRVDFTRFQSSFTIVFPNGVIDKAPKTFAFIAGFNSAASADSLQKRKQAALQNELLDAFKNLSIVDLGTIRESLTEVLNQVRFAINFMASLSFITALIVLIMTIYITRYGRIRETVLLRTLGLGSRALLKINFYEFFTLALLAVLAALLLSLGAAWAISQWIFSIPLSVNYLQITVVSTSAIGLVSLLGMWLNRGVLKVPPMEIIRRENA
jgi:putative ABC transport system permease protein